MGRETLFAHRVQWNNGIEAARTDYRSWPCLGKTLAGTETLQSIQRDREMRSVRCDVELLAEHAGRIHSLTSRIPNRTDQDGFRGSADNREVGGHTRTDVSDSGLGRNQKPENETRRDGTRTEGCNSSHH